MEQQGIGRAYLSCRWRLPVLLCALAFLCASILSPAPSHGCHGMPGWYWESFDGHWVGTDAGERLELSVDRGVLSNFYYLGTLYPGAEVGPDGSFSNAVITGNLDKSSSSGSVQICVDGCKSVGLQRIGVLDVYGREDYGVSNVEISTSGAEDSNCCWDEEEYLTTKLHREYFGDTAVNVSAVCRAGTVFYSWSMNYLPSDTPAEYANALIDSTTANPVTVTLKAGVWLSLEPYCGPPSQTLQLSAGDLNPTKKIMQTVVPGTPVNALVNQIKLTAGDKNVILKGLTFTVSGDGTPIGLATGGLPGGAKLHKDPACTGQSAGVVGTAAFKGDKLTFNKIADPINEGDSNCYLLMFRFNKKALGTYAAGIGTGGVTAVNAANQNEKVPAGGNDVPGSLEVNLDTDGDALLDYWETYGYDHEGDGVIDVDLPAMGADPKHKDLFVEIDWMQSGEHSHKPQDETMKPVIEAFKNAPVENPDGAKGVTLHLDLGDLGGGNAVPHVKDLKPLLAKFNAIKNKNFDVKRKRIFRYCLFAHAYNGSTSSGYTPAIPGSDFVVTLGAWPGGVGTAKQQAGTFMHEFGHALGLSHGGSDDVHYKPNYLSIMNYFFQMDWLRYDGEDSKLDYSRFLLKNLKEKHLNEAAALEGSAGDDDLAKYGTRFYSGGTAGAVNNCSSDVDWDGDGTISLDTVENINNDGKFTVLTGNWNDWNNIQFKGGTIGLTGAEPPRLKAADEERVTEDLTLEEYRRMKASSVEIDGLGRKR